MARKPAHMTLVGGKSPRQRIWEAVRANPARFTVDTIARNLAKAGRADEELILPYLRALTKAGIIECTEPGALMPTPTPKAWALVRDNGVEAPRLDKDGNPVTMGLGNEAMWRTIRIVRDFNASELAGHAAASGATVTVETAKGYINALAKAEYLSLVAKPVRSGRKRGSSLSRWRLAPDKNTGPRPPMIQRTKSVYDPNLGKIVWQEEPNHDC